MYLEITKAIAYYNANRSEETSKMTREGLAKIVMPDKSPNSGKQYLSRWNNGQRLENVTIDDVKTICKATGVDAEFLINQDDLKFVVGELNLLGFLKAVKGVKTPLNKLIGVEPMKKDK